MHDRLVVDLLVCIGLRDHQASQQSMQVPTLIPGGK